MSTSMNAVANLFAGNYDEIKKKDEQFAEIVEEMIGSLILEAVNHFTKFQKPSSLADDARYFYTNNEMKQFFKLFFENEGDITVLRTNRVYDDYGNFLCYEVCRDRLFKKFWNKENNVYYGVEEIDMKQFFPEGVKIAG